MEVEVLLETFVSHGGPTFEWYYVDEINFVDEYVVLADVHDEENNREAKIDFVYIKSWRTTFNYF